MPREDISMTAAELIAFLTGEGAAVLGSLDEDGGPWADTAPCLLEEETLYFAIPRNGRSFKNIQHDNRVCCSFDRNPMYYQIKGATLHGKAQPVTDEHAARRISEALRGRGGPIASAPSSEIALFSIGLDDVVSFDFTKISRRRS